MAASASFSSDPTTRPPIHTYHCLCSELVLATPLPLSQFPRRHLDAATICTLATDAGALAEPSSGFAPRVYLASEAAVDVQPLVLHLADGFEKRYLLRCARCALVLGYQLDRTQWAETTNNPSAQDQQGRREDLVYFLDGAVVTTEALQDRPATGAA